MDFDPISEAIQKTFTTTSENICLTKAIAEINNLNTQIELSMNRLRLYMKEIDLNDMCKIIDMLSETSDNTVSMSKDIMGNYTKLVLKNGGFINGELQTGTTGEDQ